MAVQICESMIGFADVRYLYWPSVPPMRPARVISLASRICQARRDAGLSQAKLAAKIGVQRTAVGQWERRNGCRPNTEHMIQVASICNVAFEWLATGRGPKWSKGQEGETPALQLNYYAHDELEERLLLAVRHIPSAQRIPLVALVEAIAMWPTATGPGADAKAADGGPLAL